MAIAHDASTRWPTTEGTTSGASGDQTTTHTPTGTPAAVVVVIQANLTTTALTGVLYGGVSMTQTARAQDTSEGGHAVIYTLTGGIPTGAQTVTFQGCSLSAKFATINTVTAGTATTTVHAIGIVDTTTAANPQVALATSVTSQIYGGLHTGAAAPSASPLTSCTLQNNVDYGALSAQTLRRTSADAPGTPVLGVTLASDDYCIAAVAISEYEPGPTPAIRSSATYAAAATESVSVVPMPAGLATGDTVYLGWELVVSSASVTTPAGWAVASPPVASSGAPSASTLGVLRKVMTGVPDTDVSISHSSGRFCAIAVAVIGADQLVPEDVAAVTDTNSGVTAPSVRAPSATPVNNNTLGLFWFANRNQVNGAATTYTPDGSLTEQADVCTTIAGVTNGGLELAYLPLSGTSATGTKTATASSASINGMGATIIVRAGVPYPAWRSIGSHQQGSVSTLSVDVPDGVAAGDIIVIPAFMDGAATITAMASGFAEAPDSPVTSEDPGGGQHHTLHILWKRATGADSTAGTYDFTLSGSSYTNADAARYSGAITSGDPWDITNSAIDVSGGGTSPAVSDTTTGVNRLLVWAASNWTGGAWTAPTGFAKRLDTGDRIVCLADMPQLTAGATGSISGASAGTGARASWLGALKPAGGSGDATANAATVAGAATIGTATVSTGSTVTGSTETGSATVPTPTVSTAGNADITTTTVAAVAAIGAPTVRTGSTISATTVAGTAAVPAVTVSTGSRTSPATVAGAATVGSATVSTGSRVNAAVVAGAATVGATTVTTGSTVSPATAAGIATVGSASVSAGGNATANPATVAGGASIPAPTVRTGSTVSASTVGASTTAPAVTVTSSAIASPATVTTSTVVGSTTVRTGSAATVATVAATTAVPVPAVSAGSRVTLATVAGVVSIGGPAVSSPATVNPATVFAVASVPAPTVTVTVATTIPRPSLGVILRPASGVITRPDLGVVLRP